MRPPRNLIVQKAELLFDQDYQRMAKELEEAAREVRELLPAGSPLAQKLESFARRIRDDQTKK